MATIIDGDSGGTAVTTVTEVKGLGDGQTWQDVKSSRVFGTT